MGWKFNPFTGALDQTGSGGGSSVIEGEVDTYNDLPLDGSAALNSSWLVRTASGSWFTGGSKPAGIYVRVNTAGSSRDNDYIYAGLLPSAFSDSELKIYHNSDSTKTAQFQLSGITAGQNRVLTVPDSSGTLALTTTVVDNAAGLWDSANSVTGAYVSDYELSVTNGTNTSSLTFPVGSSRNYTLPNASGTIARTEDFAAPPAIGNTTAAAGSFTTLTASTSLTLGTSGILSGGTNLIEQRNTTNGQTFRIYNTVSGTNDANFERLRIAWASNVAIIGTEKAGTGSARALEFQTDGTTRLTLATTGAATFSSTVIAGGAGFATNAQVTLSSNFAMDAQSAAATLNCITNPAAIRLYGLGNAGAQSTNTERLHISTRTGASYFISTQATGTGTVRALELRTNDVARLTIEAAGGLTVADANNIALGTTTGTKIGTATTQKIGFFNATPVAQQAAIADATDAATTQARLNDLLATMRTFGLIAT